MSLLSDHFAAVEASLLAQAGIQVGAGHNLHKGTPREAFIRTFLANHLSERMALGTGEVISANCKSGEPRNQHDIVLYKRDYPKLDLGGGINAFLAESVIATIEVKSVLTKDELHKAFGAARKIKCLPRHEMRAMSAGYRPPSVLSYVVAYGGPASMATVYGWLPSITQMLGLEPSKLGPTLKERISVAAPAIDGVFVLGQGFLTFDNSPLSCLSDAECAASPGAVWVYGDMPKGSLMLLFMLLTMAVSGMTASWLNPVPYLTGLEIKDPRGGSGT
jgi:hypothetical protein